MYLPPPGRPSCTPTRSDSPAAWITSWSSAPSWRSSAWWGPSPWSINVTSSCWAVAPRLAHLKALLMTPQSAPRAALLVAPGMLDPFVLEGSQVRLEPLRMDHIEALVRAASEDRSNYQWTYTPDGREQMTAYVVDALEKVASGAHVAFVTVRRQADGSELVVGATRYCEMYFWQWPPGASHQRHGIPDVVDIGFTWLSGPAQRSAVNTEAKLLMMEHAFGAWQVHRIGFQA